MRNLRKFNLDLRASPGGSAIKNPPAIQETTCDAGDMGSSPGSEDPLEKEMATHSSIPA